MARCEQTSVCLSKLAQCVSKVYSSSRTRWQRPARIKEVALWRLSPSALSQPGMRVLHHLTWSVTSVRGERRGGQCAVVHLGRCFSSFLPDWLRLHLTRQPQHTSAQEMAWWLLLIKVIAAVPAPAFNVCEIINARSGSIILRVKLM